MKRKAYPSSDNLRSEAQATPSAPSRLWGRLVDPERPVMRWLTFAATVLALVGGLGGVVAWFGQDEDGGSEASASKTATPTSSGISEIRAKIGDCLSETARVARQMKTFQVDEIIKLDIQATQDRLSFSPWGGTPNRLDEAARYVLANFACSGKFPPGMQLGAVDLEGRPGWDFEHGAYQLVGTYALEDFGTGTGGVQWYSLRQVRPEDLR